MKKDILDFFPHSSIGISQMRMRAQEKKIGAAAN
jgi:hypothetical protein